MAHYIILKLLNGVVFLPLFAAARVRKTQSFHSTLETFFIRVTMETIIGSFETRTQLLVLLEKSVVDLHSVHSLSVHVFDCLVPLIVPFPLGHSCWSVGQHGLVKPYSVVSKGFWHGMFCCPGWRQSEEHRIGTF